MFGITDILGGIFISLTAEEFAIKTSVVGRSDDVSAAGGVHLVAVFAVQGRFRLGRDHLDDSVSGVPDPREVGQVLFVGHAVSPVVKVTRLVN